MVQNRDVGFVCAGQSAEIKVDTFSFTKYSLLYGTVLNVSANSIDRKYRCDEPVSCRAVAGSGAGRARHPADEGRLAYRRRAARARKPQSGVPATLLARAQPDRAAMAASAQQPPVSPRLSND
jgi:hypothetical protein